MSFSQRDLRTKTIFATITVFIMVFSIVSFAEDTLPDFTYRILPDGTAEITGYNGSDTTVTVPAVIDGLSVSCIAQNAFEMSDTVHTLVIETPMMINGFPFPGCESLADIFINADLTGLIPSEYDYAENTQTIRIQKDLIETISLFEQYGIPYETFDVLYTANVKTKKLHISSCSSVSDMKNKNKMYLTDRDLAISQGYEPCKRCNP